MPAMHLEVIYMCCCVCFALKYRIRPVSLLLTRHIHLSYHTVGLLFLMSLDSLLFDFFQLGHSKTSHPLFRSSAVVVHPAKESFRRIFQLDFSLA